MRLKAVVIIPRKDQAFRTSEAIVVKTKGFKGFKMDQVPAYYRKRSPGRVIYPLLISPARP